jgi:hypothetical protein
LLLLPPRAPLLAWLEQAVVVILDLYFALHLLHDIKIRSSPAYSRKRKHRDIILAAVSCARMVLALSLAASVNSALVV